MKQATITLRRCYNTGKSDGIASNDTSMDDGVLLPCKGGNPKSQLRQEASPGLDEKEA